MWGWGRCTRNYIWRLKRDRGYGRDVKDVVCDCICGLMPGMLFNYLLAGVVSKTYTHTQLCVIAKRKRKVDWALMG